MRKISVEIVYKKKKDFYEHDVATLKDYGGRYKITWQRSKMNKGVTFERRARNTANDDKLDCNIRRAKNKIKEYALCNEWDYFCTLTLDQMKMDRYDIKDYIKKLGQLIRDIRKATGANIQYLLIPEQHKDGAWHMHGLIRGLTDDMLTKAKKSGRKRTVYNWDAYSDKFGFSDLERIEDTEKVASYITKYVTKDMARSIKELNAKSYYCSRGLSVAKTIKKGAVSEKYNPTYVKTIYDEPLYSEMWLPNNTTLEEALEYLQDTSWHCICQEDGVLVEDVPLEWI